MHGETTKRRFDRATLRRIVDFARPHRRALAGFLALSVTTALLTVATPVLAGRVVDEIVDGRDEGRVITLAVIIAVIALLDAVVGIAERWQSAKIGEGLILDLRRAVFRHVQRMPVAFFTSTQTGALISLLNNVVIGAQRALTGTLGTLVSNVFTLAFALSFMLALEWRITLLALAVLPGFTLLARRIGRKLQALTRQAMVLNADMNSQMTERFNVAGASLVKLFGSARRENETFSRRAGAVRDAGIRQAMLGRVFFVALGLVAALGTAAIYGIGAQLVVSGEITTGTLVALAALVTRIYQPLTGLTNARVDLMTSMVSFERVFEVLDAPEPIADRPGAFELIDPKGRIEFRDVVFRYPPASESSIATMEQTFGIPVLTSNQTILWRALRAAKCNDPISSLGRIFHA